MNTERTWPDRTLYSAVVQNPQLCFDDPELQGAAFARGRQGVMAWSGGRAIVFRADCGSGRFAVRFLLHDDREAGTRYETLSRHLSANPVSTFVRTRWMAEGLRVNPQRYPLVKMDWIEGDRLDRYVSTRLGSPNAAGELRALSEEWRRHCRQLMDVGMSHGDVHAGNVLVLAAANSPTKLRMVDYDNVWVPGLNAPCREAGHPAFQHPARRCPDTGPHLDAVPNTLTYLSLLGVISDPGLWNYHADNDDTLLFQRRDLETPTTDVWTALLDSKEPEVRALAAVTCQWLGGAPRLYESLEQVIVAARSRQAAAPTVWNVWPPRPPAGAGNAGGAASQGAPRPGVRQSADQSWPGRAAGPAGSAGGRPGPSPNRPNPNRPNPNRANPTRPDPNRPNLNGPYPNRPAATGVPTRPVAGGGLSHGRETLIAVLVLVLIVTVLLLLP